MRRIIESDVRYIHLTNNRPIHRSWHGLLPNMSIVPFRCDTMRRKSRFLLRNAYTPGVGVWHADGHVRHGDHLRVAARQPYVLVRPGSTRSSYDM